MVIVIVGPTGIGKTTLSIELAKYLKTEIISGDSVQIYKDLTIGSAKVSKKEMQGITHHLIDVLEPTENYSVSDYQQEVRCKIKEIQNKGMIPIIAGGTGLYIKAVLYDYNFKEEGRNPEFYKQYEQLTNEEVFELLKKLDPKACEKLHYNNRKRVLRALERAQSGNLLSEENKGNNKLYDSIIIGLTTDRDLLYQKINERVDQMITNGLVEEVRNLHQRKIRTNAVSAIGYKELYDYFDNHISLDEAIEKIKLNTRRFAKKQYTWFNNQMNVHWIKTDFDQFSNTVQEAISYITSKNV